jgi:ubiquinone/menaquinone biosynthesis C-methylase UbiE
MLRFAAHTCDAAMSVDVLWMVPDRPAALREVARVLKPGARFVCTNWDRYMGAEAVQSMLFEARRALGLIDGVGYLRHSRRMFVVARRS